MTALTAYRQALESMVFQFGYRGVKNGKPIIGSGGSSALEEAFRVLGWPDPRVLPEEGYTCEIVGCVEEDSAGIPWGNLYLRLCFDHYKACRNGEERPPIKAWALEREAKRGKGGILESK